MRLIMLAFHFVGLAMGVGTSFAFLFLGRAASKLEREEAKMFYTNALILTKMGYIGITLLVLTGLYLVQPYLAHITNYPYLIAKLSLVVVLIVLIIINGINAQKFKKGDASRIKIMKPIGTISLLLVLVIISLAVLNFK